MATVRFESDLIVDWDSFHQVCRTAFGFPDFYGNNMNAWIDCLSYLRDDDRMTRFCISRDEVLSIEVKDADSFKSRIPEIFDEFLDSVTFVNRRYIEQGERPALSLVLM